MRYDKMISGEVAKLKRIKECGEHEWIGPIKKIEHSDGMVFYQVQCRYCPLGKMFVNESDAEVAIGAE